MTGCTLKVGPLAGFFDWYGFAFYQAYHTNYNLLSWLLFLLLPASRSSGKISPRDVRRRNRANGQAKHRNLNWPTTHTCSIFNFCYMSFFFRKTFRIGPIRINISKRGVGVSIGVPGARIGKSATGQTYVSGSVPGTGLGYRKNIKGKKSTK